MHYWITCFLLLFNVSLFGQVSSLFSGVDTIKAGFETGGNLESTDKEVGFLSSTIPGGGFTRNAIVLQPHEWVDNSGSQRFFSHKSWNKMRFSGMPHMGFAYAFGGNGMQYIHVNFQQAFTQKLLLNIDFSKSSAANFLRSNEFAHNDLQIQLNRKSERFSFATKLGYESADVSQSGGLVSDSLVNDLPLIFLPVNKQNARLETKRFRLAHVNYIDFQKDSLIEVGLYTKHDLSIKKFTYSETDANLASIYAQINMDSVQTADQHQWSQIANGSGFFYKNKQQFIQLGLESRFWNFQNLGKYYDTLEMVLIGDYHLKKNGFQLDNQTEFSLVGAANELFSRSTLSKNVGTTQFKASIYFENKLPAVHQRYAIGNNYSTYLQSPTKQTVFQPAISLRNRFSSFLVGVNYSYTALRDVYYFVVDQWRNDLFPKLNFHQIKLDGKFTFKKLIAEPTYTFTHVTPEFTAIPQHQLNARFYWKNTVFKEKKMTAYAGFDLSAVSRYSRLGFYSNIGAFAFDNLGVEADGWLNAHVFAGFKLDVFKFFVRMENLAYFWNDKSIPLLNSFPIPTNQLRVGLTWDFFN